ncbi:MAG: 2OG-Fe(II) oxygenase family protein [Methylococcales bacterium]
MINENIDLDLIKKDYTKNGYVRIEKFFNEEYVKKIANSIFNEISWDLCYLSDSGPISIKEAELKTYTAQQSSELNQKIMSRAQQGFSYYYYRSDLVNSVNKVLKIFYKDLSGDEFIDFCRELTGENSIDNVNGQLACYSPGCFLRKHTDETNKENRVAAYVINFTPQWNNDWGGNLHILDKQHQIVKTLDPLFNSISIFKVPTLHYVSQVANYARGKRFTATGWMLMPD